MKWKSKPLGFPDSEPLGVPASRASLSRGLNSLRRAGATGLKVNIVSYEDSSWILGKIAQRLSEELQDCGALVTQSNAPLSGFDVVHHIPFHPVAKRSDTNCESMMVTHLDTSSKLSRVRRLAREGVLPIAMSRQTAALVNKDLDGESRSKAVWALMPSFLDEPPRLRIGLFFRLYADGRKRQHLLRAALQKVGFTRVQLFIMGSGWEPEIEVLEAEGVKVSYQADFDSVTYRAWLELVDFVLITGRDEGAVSFLDALAAGTRVIASRIGYHADYKHELVHYANSAAEIGRVLRAEAYPKQTAFLLVAASNWRRYALEHLGFWLRPERRPV